MSFKIDPELKFYIRVDRRGIVVPGTGIFRKHAPKRGRWITLDANICCPSTTSTTTTTTTTAGA